MMNIRWVFHTFWPELPQINHTIIAMWWPWEYYCVSTTQVGTDMPDPVCKSLRRSCDLPEAYVTHVYKCDRDGKSDGDYSYYKKEYPDSILAKKGHTEVVELMEKGGLTIKQQACNN